MKNKRFIFSSDRAILSRPHVINSRFYSVRKSIPREYCFISSSIKPLSFHKPNWRHFALGLINLKTETVFYPTRPKSKIEKIPIVQWVCRLLRIKTNDSFVFLVSFKSRRKRKSFRERLRNHRHDRFFDKQHFDRWFVDRRFCGHQSCFPWNVNKPRAVFHRKLKKQFFLCKNL